MASYGWMATPVLIVSMIFVVLLFVGHRLSTVPELLERRFDARLRKYLSAVSTLLGTATGHLIGAAWFAATPAGWLHLEFTLVTGAVLLATVVAIAWFQRLLPQTRPSAPQLQAVDHSRMPAIPVRIVWTGLAVTLATLFLVFCFH